jgi:hypothetical protein
MALPPKTASTIATITIRQDEILAMVVPPLRFASIASVQTLPGAGLVSLGTSAREG